MKMRDAILPEYDHEMALTRRVLERVPDAHLAWQPHAKSMSLGRLATHLAELPAFGGSIFAGSSLDLAPKDGGGYKGRVLGANQENLELFDANVAAAREALAAAEDDAMRETWTLKMGDRVLFSLPRIAVVRSMLLNHIIHHRGQMSVYLRLHDVPVPSIYGPSADEMA